MERTTYCELCVNHDREKPSGGLDGSVAVRKSLEDMKRAYSADSLADLVSLSQTVSLSSEPSNVHFAAQPQVGPPLSLWQSP
jgi:hypothetical protein